MARAGGPTHTAASLGDQPVDRVEFFRASRRAALCQFASIAPSSAARRTNRSFIAEEGSRAPGRRAVKENKLVGIVGHAPRTALRKTRVTPETSIRNTGLDGEAEGSGEKAKGRRG